MASYCIDCGCEKEPSRAKSYRCRACDQARKWQWLAEAPRCNHCGQVLPPEMRGKPAGTGEAVKARARARRRDAEAPESDPRPAGDTAVVRAARGVVEGAEGGF